MSITEDLLLSFSGCSSLAEIEDIVLRDQSLTSIQVGTQRRPCQLFTARLHLFLLQGLQRCQRLQTASLAHNALSHVDMATVMTYVTELNLCHNRLSDISGLQCASSLQLPHHHIVMLLRYFPALRRLYLAHNSVNSLHALMPCQLLEVLDARSNDLVDLDGVIQVLRSLPHLSQVEMEGNPCAAHRLYKANLVASAGLKMLDGRFVVLYPLYCFHSRSFSRSVVTSLDVEGGRQMLLEAAPPSTPRGTAPRPVIRLSPPPNERLSSGRPTTAGGGAPSAAVQAATAAIAASAALSRNPIFLECVPARHFEI